MTARNGASESPEISVVLATRNRSGRLAKALASLADQQTTGTFTFEVIVVDNGSTDQTRQVVEDWISRAPGRFRYMHEAREGKVHALNAGLRAVTGTAVAFLDDDEQASPEWLLSLWRCLNDCGADGVTGRMVPDWDVQRPAWLSDRLMGVVGCPVNGDSRVEISSDWEQWWCGGNAIMTRALLKQLGGFNPHLARVEDTELAYRAARAGARLVYEPQAQVAHQVPSERVTRSYVRWWFQETGRYEASYRVVWKWHHRLTLMPLWWYGRTASLGAKYIISRLRRHADDTFWYELLLTAAMASLGARWDEVRAGLPASPTEKQKI